LDPARQFLRDNGGLAPRPTIGDPEQMGERFLWDTRA